jgi:hypothetical protein
MNLRELIHKDFGIRNNDNLPFVSFGSDSNRHMIAKVMAKAGFKVGAEIGVEWARHARAICVLMPRVKLFCVDPYAPYLNGRPSQGRQDHIMECAVEKMKEFDVTFVRKSSVEASKDFENESLDFVYIDGAHDFDNVMLDVIHWVPKVKKGGIVAGHDYFQFYQSGVIPAINAYTYAHNIKEWYITSEHISSWFWIK